MERKISEKNWGMVDATHQLHTPPNVTLGQLPKATRQETGIVMICGHEFLIATDGQLEPVTTE